MAFKLSAAARNARLDAIETFVGAAPILWLISGAAPTNITDSDGGTVLASLTLPSDYMANAASGQKALSGTWSAAATAAGTVGHFRITKAGVSSANMLSGGTYVEAQGSVTATGGGGDMTLDNAVVAVDQVVTINTFTLTDGNA